MGLLTDRGHCGAGSRAVWIRIRAPSLAVSGCKDRGVKVNLRYGTVAPVLRARTVAGPGNR